VFTYIDIIQYNHPHTETNAHNLYKITDHPYILINLHISAINEYINKYVHIFFIKLCALVGVRGRLELQHKE